MVRNISRGHYGKVRRAVVATGVALICAAAMIFHMVNVFGTTLALR
ncbi:MAG: hypothetical protein Q4A01_07680 [Coriobacteriales bacterium]|nr:hypothetical protein [Coriobacteriales bacterium]